METPRGGKFNIAKEETSDYIDVPSFPKLSYDTPSKRIIPLTPSLQRLKETKNYDSPCSECSILTTGSDEDESPKIGKKVQSNDCEDKVSSLEKKYKNMILLKDCEITNLKEELERIKREYHYDLLEEECCTDNNSEQNMNQLTKQIKELKIIIMDKDKEITVLNQSLKLIKEQYMADLKINEENMKRISELIEIKEADYEKRLKCLESEKENINILLDTAEQNISLIKEDKNATIYNLKNQLHITEGKIKQVKSDKYHLYSEVQKLIKQQKYYLNVDSELFDLTDKYEKLESLLKEKDNELENLKTRVKESEDVKNKLQVLQKNLQKMTEEKNNLQMELAKLMGHQNHLQKIRHVNQLKQKNNQLQEEVNRLNTENFMLKKKHENNIVSSRPRRK